MIFEFMCFVYIVVAHVRLDKPNSGYIVIYSLLATSKVVYLASQLYAAYLYGGNLEAAK